MGKISVVFSANGNTAVFENNEQVPNLQKSWVILFAEFLKENGVDPTKVEIFLPGVNKAAIFELGDKTYSWRIT